MQQTFLEYAFLNSEFIKFNDANVSIATHALHYGTAAFGGLRGYVDEKNPNGAYLFRLDDHAKRLSQSARYLQADFSADFIKQKIIEFVKLNKPKTSFYIRPLVYLSDLGIVPRVHNAEKDLLIYGMQLGDYLSSDGISVCFSSWARQPDASLPLRGKLSGAYITSSMAKTEAIDRGFDEAILMTTEGKVAEASGMNIFMVRDGKLITPGVEQDILEGITRRSVIQVARDLGYEVIERPLDKSELLIADEAFLCGTAAKVSPIAQVENFKLSTPGEITKKIADVFREITIGKSENYEDWLDFIEY
jgi:branched-chain amino acid aminotransferase